MSQAHVATWVLKFLAVCYGYSLLMATGNVVNCEARKPMACGQQWTQAFTVAGSTAGTLLAPTDWYITRKMDTGIEIPAEVKQYRDEIRLTCGLREDQIAQCTSTEGLAALLTNPAQVYDEATNSMVPNTEPHIMPWPKQQNPT